MQEMVTRKERFNLMIQISNRIFLSISQEEMGDTSDEGYQLEVTTKEIVLTSPTRQGLVRGLQTIPAAFAPINYATQSCNGH